MVWKLEIVASQRGNEEVEYVTQSRNYVIQKKRLNMEIESQEYKLKDKLFPERNSKSSDTQKEKWKSQK